MIPLTAKVENFLRRTIGVRTVSASQSGNIHNKINYVSSAIDTIETGVTAIQTALGTVTTSASSTGHLHNKVNVLISASFTTSVSASSTTASSISSGYTAATVSYASSSVLQSISICAKGGGAEAIMYSQLAINGTTQYTDIAVLKTTAGETFIWTIPIGQRCTGGYTFSLRGTANATYTSVVISSIHSIY